MYTDYRISQNKTEWIAVGDHLLPGDPQRLAKHLTVTLSPRHISIGWSTVIVTLVPEIKGTQCYDNTQHLFGL